MNTEILKEFPDIEFITQKERLMHYQSDASENLIFPPNLVALPNSTAEVASLVSYCCQHSIPIFPRGAGTGLAGGSLSTEKGLMISLEKMNRILTIDTENFMATVEAGLINYHLQEALLPHNLFFPPDPSSWQSSFIGGNIATNAGGPRAVKYGVTSDWVLNLEVVLPNGSIIWTGKNVLKNATGYQITPLFIGSEGTLGIITQAVVKVAPKPQFETTMLVPFKILEECAEAVAYLFQQGMQPSTLEFIERKALEKLQEYSPEIAIPMSNETQAHLLISYDGNQKETLLEEMEKTYELLMKFAIEDPILADSETEKNRIWKARRSLAEIIKMNGYTIEEDTVVPRNKLPQLIHFAHSLEKKYSIDLVCYGHAGDGNIHIRIKHPQYSYSYQNPEVEEILLELFQYIHTLGGTVSAEHGIGIVQKKYLSTVFSQEELIFNQNIKHSIDPKNIMNPGKIF